MGRLQPWNCSMVLLLAMAILAVVSAATVVTPQIQEIITMEGAPQGMAWAVQLSDLHLSVFHPDRAKDLGNLASQALNLVNPAVVLVTGDLTDAKNRKLTLTRQDEAEWLEYRHTIAEIVQKTDIPEWAFFDLRGNHDKFGVPYVTSELDYFSRYSLTSKLNRTLVQSVVVKAGGNWKYQFVGFDDSMQIGLRGPSNLFGHPTDDILNGLESELSKYPSSDKVAKVVFGHFPMSFTTSSESGRRPEDIFARNGVSAYVCGHLHTKFGKQLYKLHSRRNEVGTGTNEFWEWEMGDWRSPRMMRIIAFDHGHVSFVDFSLKGFTNETTVVLPTYPLDSRFMKKHPAAIGFDNDPVGDSIRTVVFSNLPTSRVTARIFDGKSGTRVLADELEMELVPGSPSSASGLVYKAAWRRNRYSDPSPLRYWLEVSVTDSLGRVVTSERRPFSVDGNVAKHSLGFWGFVVMGIQWADAYPVFFWVCMVTIGCMLLLPKVYLWHLRRNRSYNTFVVSVLSEPWNLRHIWKLPVWVLVEGCRSSGLWWSEVLLVGYLLVFPWFWGIPTAPGYPTGYMTYRGWQIEGEPSVVGTADMLSIVLPFCYSVVLPLVVIIALMVAEKAAWEFRSTVKCHQVKKEESGVKRSLIDSGLRQLLEEVPEAISNQQQQQQQQLSKRLYRVCGGWMRALLLGCCLLIGWLHWRQCSRVAAAYGPNAVLVSPGFAWTPPLFMALAVYETCSIRRP